MKIALSSDMTKPIVDTIYEWLIDKHHDVIWHKSDTDFPWPEAAARVAKSLQSGESDYGIVLCWTGTGVSIAANKFRGIRAALCKDAETAKGSKLWNNANVLCLAINELEIKAAEEIIDTWFSTDYQPTKEDDHCLSLLEKIEENEL